MANKRRTWSSAITTGWSRVHYMTDSRWQGSSRQLWVPRTCRLVKVFIFQICAKEPDKNFKMRWLLPKALNTENDESWDLYLLFPFHFLVTQNSTPQTKPTGPHQDSRTSAVLLLSRNCSQMHLSYALHGPPPYCSVQKNSWTSSLSSFTICYVTNRTVEKCMRWQYLFSSFGSLCICKQLLLLQLVYLHSYI